MRKLKEISVKQLALIVITMGLILTLTACAGDVEESAEESVQEESMDELVEDSEEDLPETADDITAIGEGDTMFVFTVTFEDATMQIYEVSTNETTVGAALLAEGLIEGEDSEFGLYVKTVNGVTLDYDTDGAYWGFYVNGETASAGVDSTDIVDGATYTLAYTK